MSTPKLIRELRMGPAKCFKTGAVVSSYPRPLLCLEFDQEGLDIIKEPIIFVKPEELESLCKGTPAINPNGIYAVDFCDTQVKLMTEVYQPLGNSTPFNTFVKCVNTVVKQNIFKTVIVDSISGLGDAIFAHISATNASALGSALKWAPMIGGKIHQCMSVITGLNSHAVFIMHSTSPVANETTSVVTVAPMVPSQWMRDRAGTLVSQFFYQCKDGGKPMVYTTDQLYVKGIGARWPSNLPAKVGPLFNDIYGKELLSK